MKKVLAILLLLTTAPTLCFACMQPVTRLDPAQGVVFQLFWFISTAAILLVCPNWEISGSGRRSGRYFRNAERFICFSFISIFTLRFPPLVLLCVCAVGLFKAKQCYDGSVAHFRFYAVASVSCVVLAMAFPEVLFYLTGSYDLRYITHDPWARL